MMQSLPPNNRVMKLKATEHNLLRRFRAIGFCPISLPYLIHLLVMQRAADELDAGFYREAAFAVLACVQFIPTHMYQLAPEAAAKHLSGVLPGGIVGVTLAVIF